MLLLQSLIGHFDLDPNRVFDIVSWMFLVDFFLLIHIPIYVSFHVLSSY